MLVRRVALFCTLLMAASCGQRENQSLEEAVREAKKRNTDILLLVTKSDECFACSLLEENVLQNPDWTPEKNFAVCRIDHTAKLREEAPEVWREQELLFLRYGIDSFPTILLCDSEAWPYYKGHYNDEPAAEFLARLLDARALRGAKLRSLLASAQAEGSQTGGPQTAALALDILAEWGVDSAYYQLKALAAPDAPDARYAVELARYWFLQGVPEEARVWEDFLQKKWPEARRDFDIWRTLRDVEEHESQAFDWEAAWGRLAPLWGQAASGETKYQLASALGELAWQLRRRDECILYFRRACDYAPDDRVKDLLQNRLRSLEAQDF